MKKHIFSIGLLCSVMASFSFAQSHVDALRYSQHTPGGTARSVAMGGAFGALGGDFSALSQNPAGLGVYRSSEFTFTPEFYFRNATTRYYGNETEESKFNFNISNLGYVGVFEPGSSSSLTTFNFGIGFNRIANFHRNSVINGDNPYTSYADFMAADATAYGFNDSYSFFTSALFYDAYVIDEAINWNPQDPELEGVYWINDDYLISNSFRPTEQKVINNERGRINEWTISLGFNFSDVFYLGGTFGIQPLYYESEKSFKEYRASDRMFNYFTYNEELTVRGTGYTAKIGAIARPFPALRLGAALHLPVSYLLEEEFETSITSRYVNGTIYPEDNFGDRLNSLESEYRITTPFKAIGSAAVVAGKFLILSGDFEFIDYSNMRMKGSSGIDLSGQNDEIRRVYNQALNVKLGTELRFGSTYLRGGFGYYGSPYAVGEENADAYRLSYSGGFGIRDDDMFIDIAFEGTGYDERKFLYGASDGNGVLQDNPVNFDDSSIRIMTTIGFKF